MKDPNDIRTLADWRYEEAENLSKIGYHDGAFYLAGYAVELCLKAKFATHSASPIFIASMCLNLTSLRRF